MDIATIYKSRFLFKAYQELIFYPFRDFKKDFLNPYLFVVNRRDTMAASHFHLSSFEERGYDIHLVTAASSVLFYVIDIKYPHIRAVGNGLIISERGKALPSDREGITVRYNFDHFQVFTNKLQTSAIFGRNITVDPKT